MEEGLESAEKLRNWHFDEVSTWGRKDRKGRWVKEERSAHSKRDGALKIYSICCVARAHLHKWKDVRSTVNGTISWLDCLSDYFVPEWNMSAKYSINWHEIGFVQTTIQLIGVTPEQGRWTQMREAAGRECSGWALMRITAIPGTGKHEGTSGNQIPETEQTIRKWKTKPRTQQCLNKRLDLYTE